MPDSKTPPFPNPPLALTVLEIRYPELSEGIGKGAQQHMREALRSRLPLIENITEDQLQLAIGAPMPASVQRRSFPRFVTRDRTTALVVKEGALVLETTTYEGWEEDFLPTIQDVVDALHTVGQPDGILRIGLRYIDEIRVREIIEPPGNWSGYIDEHLLAAASEDFIPPSLQPDLWQGVVTYRTATDSTLTVRYGPRVGHAVNPKGATRRRNPPEPGLFFLLDSDSFWQAEDEVPEFDTKTILDRCGLLHAPARDFFKIAVTDKLRNEVFMSKEGNTT